MSIFQPTFKLPEKLENTLNFKSSFRPWARIQATSASLLILIGALVLLLAYKTYTIYSFIMLASSLTTIIIEYPRKRFHIPILSSNCYVKTIMYLVISGIGLINAPTHTGSLCLACAALTYLAAAINGENGCIDPETLEEVRF